MVKKNTTKRKSAKGKKPIKFGLRLTDSMKQRLIFAGKIIGIFVIAIVVLVFLIWLIFGRHKIAEEDDIVWGTTWSNLAAEELGIDAEVAYKSVVEDLKPQRLRLIAYWNRTESERDKFDFSELDYQVELAEKYNIPYVIAVGNRVPRYPECHTPSWAEYISGEEYKNELIDFVGTTIHRYNKNEGLSAWQIENEAFVGSFGICPDLDEDLLAEEIEFARSKTDKKIILTESGELSLWFKASGYPDILGTTLYRTVIFGKTDIVVRHVFPPSYYRARSNIVKLINGNLDDVIVAELQGEPWASKPIPQADESQLQSTMNPKQFEHNIEFTESVGFPEVWWWGVEWWYYQSKNGDGYYWERAKQLFR